MLSRELIPPPLPPSLKTAFEDKLIYLLNYQK